MTVNVHGIKGKGKQKELELLFDIEKPDIVMVMGTESHLTDEYPDLIFLEDYLVWRKDWNVNGGGYLWLTKMT